MGKKSLLSRIGKISTSYLFLNILNSLKRRNSSFHFIN
ncbi:hypothetical protein MJ1HA_1500 [Metallosphaera sedula]|nr:hypothetical protein MJ1HA_1500 [Metallosphaera sedula]